MASGRPPPNRGSSASQTGNDHAPARPSGLRQSHTLSSNDLRQDGASDEPAEVWLETRSEHSDTWPDRPPTEAGPSVMPNPNSLERDERDERNERNERLGHEQSETSLLLSSATAHPGPCNHGTFSPHPLSPSASSFQTSNSTSASIGDSEGSNTALTERISKSKSWKKAISSRMKSKTISNSRALAAQHGLKDSQWMYFSYYVPCLVWMRQYSWSWFMGDLTAAITIASMYLPMALSYAENLAHVPPINGLYAFIFNPFIYGLLGSCPQMVVGPEAAGSLLIGSVVKDSIDSGLDEDDAIMSARICGVAVGMAGATVFIMGAFRLGFLDSVLSRPFLRGFISAIGVVIFIDQLIPVMGLAVTADHAEVSHGSSIDKLRFLLTHLDDVHTLSAIVGLVSFTVIMVLRETKRRLQPSYAGVAYVPDRLIVVVISALLARSLMWDKSGVAILGDVQPATGKIFTFRNPFQLDHMEHIREAMGTSFLIGMLGFFESSVAAKSLGSGEVIEGMQLSPNRELIALGTANLVGSCFMAIPAFGGYGRSKVNKSTGGTSPMSSILVAIITTFCVVFALSWFYYIPKPVLSSLIMVVAWSLIEEAPHDVAFFLQIRGWNELSLMVTILLVTVFFSLNLGIAIGIGLSLLQVIRHSTRPRIQILGRVPSTDRFENAEENPERLEFIEGCLIVKIPEPLTFANTGELKNRLRRLELYGTGIAHPALPRLRPRDSNRNVIFDVHGVTSLDGSGAQVLGEIVRNYRDRGVRVFFSRVPSSRAHPVRQLMERAGIVTLVGGDSHFVNDVEEALRLTELEDFELCGSYGMAADATST